MVYRLVSLGKEAGVRGLFAGLGPRMSEFLQLSIHHALAIYSPQHKLMINLLVVMTAGLVSSQFLMYGAIKNALGAGEGVTIHKD